MTQVRYLEFMPAKKYLVALTQLDPRRAPATAKDCPIQPSQRSGKDPRSHPAAGRYQRQGRLPQRRSDRGATTLHIPERQQSASTCQRARRNGISLAQRTRTAQSVRPGWGARGTSCRPDGLCCINTNPPFPTGSAPSERQTGCYR